MSYVGIGPLINLYNRLEKDDTYHKIVGIILQNISRLGNMSIRDAADLCFTSGATISRLAKRAGYDGFNELKATADQFYSDYYRHNRVIEPDKLIDADAADVYLQTIIAMLGELNEHLDRNVINEAVSMIDQAKAVYYFGSCEAARRFQQDLFMQGKLVEIYQMFDAENPSLIEWQKNSVAIIEYPGYPWFEFRDMVRKIKETGTKVFLITCSSSPEVHELADLCIKLEGTKSGRDEVLYMAVMTILSLEYRKKCIDSWYYN